MKVDGIFHHLHAVHLRTTTWACLCYKFPSSLPGIERGDLKRGCTPGEDICFVSQPVSLMCRTWQVKPLRSACTGTAQDLWKRLLLHCHHAQPFTFTLHSSCAQKKLGTTVTCTILWEYCFDFGLGRRLKIATKHGIISEWAWSRLYVVERI